MGYVAIGFSPNGAMRGADIFLGWVDDDNGTISAHVSITDMNDLDMYINNLF